MKLLTVAIICIAFLTGCGGSDTDSDLEPQNETARPAAEAGKISLWSRQDGYDAAVFLPADYGLDPERQYPLIVSLYGLNGSVLNDDHTQVGGQKSGFIKQVWNTDLSKTYPAIVIAPEINSDDSDERNLWSYDRLFEFLMSAVERYNIDEDRIVFTGYSAGSAAAQEFALRSKDIVAGIMPGAFEAVIKLNVCSVADLPIWSFGNSSDVIFQPASWRETENLIKDCPRSSKNFRLTIDENNCGHECWDDHWKKADVQTWLAIQEK